MNKKTLIAALLLGCLPLLSQPLLAADKAAALAESLSSWSGNSRHEFAKVKERLLEREESLSKHMSEREKRPAPVIAPPPVFAADEAVGEQLAAFKARIQKTGIAL